MTSANAPTPLPHGSWPSPVSAADLVASGGTSADPRSDGGLVHWLRTAPETGARVILSLREADGSVRDLSPEWMSVRSRVHEYGGGAWTVRDGVVVAVDLVTQQLWRLDGEPRPLSPTPAEGEDAAVRWAAPEVDVARGVCFVVREDHRGTDVEPVNEIVRVPLDGPPGFGEVVVAGRRRALPRPDADDAGDPALPDFVSDPVLSPDGARLAWVQWSHPAMPWDAASVVVADLDEAGDAVSVRRVGGGPGQTATEPVWVDATRLAFLADPEGWAVPHVVDVTGSSDPLALAPTDSEWGLPGWMFRTRAMALAPDGRLVGVRTVDGLQRLSTVTPSLPGAVTDLDLPLLAASGLAPHDGGLVLDAGLPDVGAAASTVALEGSSATLEVLAARGTVPDPAYVAAAEAVSWTGHAGDTAYGFLHRPTHPDVTGPEGELPPLVVIAHGGPTSATNAVPRTSTAWFTSRGIAVLDVNYAGSTGYGRAYRERLTGTWGVADIEDVVAGARHLAETGVVDGARLGVRGGSAGGFVVFAALAFHDAFSAGVSYFGVSDLSLLAQETHKMESRYLDGLVGPWPAAREIYAARSPLHHVEDITAPLLLLQGDADRVVPPSQAEVMEQGLRALGRPVALEVFAGEGHGFRAPENIVRAAEVELSFLGQVWGFTPAGDLPEVDLG
ncbi:S9 family peptidase [Nocardioides korecus]